MAGKITVFGSFVVDLASRADHLPTPAESVIGTSFAIGPGGKGSNQAVAAHRAGADVTMVTKVGNDVFSKVVLDFYTNEGMSTDYIFIDDEKETGSALIMIDENSGQNQILVVPGACMNIKEADIKKAAPALQAADIVLMQLEVNLDANSAAIEIAKKAGAKVVLNTAPVQMLPDEMIASVDMVTPNEVEASVLTGVEVVDMDDAKRAADVFQKKGCEEVVITMGEQGAYVRNGEGDIVIARRTVTAVDTTGAGDAFNGGLVTALAEGKGLFEAAQFANVVGALSVTKEGTAPSMPTREEIDAFL